MITAEPDSVVPRPVSESCLNLVFDLERLVFSDPWTHGMLEDALAWPETIAICAGPFSALSGVIFLRAFGDEAEILRLAVNPAHRRKRLGSLLVERGLLLAKNRGAEKVFLEVRENNLPAIGFYKAHNFKLVGARPRYYADTGEAALVMAKSL